MTALTLADGRALQHVCHGRRAGHVMDRNLGLLAPKAKHCYLPKRKHDNMAGWQRV